MRSNLSPKLFAIDTSILGKVASDYFSPVSSKSKKARKFLSTIADRGLVPLFCMHHFQELMQHKNDLKVLNRLRFIKKFSQIAWVKPSSPEGLVGSIIDIQGSEMLRLIDNPQISLHELISETRKQIIDYSTGEYLINNIGEELLQVHKSYLNLIQTIMSETPFVRKNTFIFISCLYLTTIRRFSSIEMIE